MLRKLFRPRARPAPEFVTTGPLVSVVIPAYNHERYVRDTIASVLAQTYQCLELIIVNDGSTDETGAICRRTARTDQRIHYHEQTNQGAHQAINHGISLAKGDYVSILNSDDLFAPNKLERCIEIVGQYPDIQFISGHVELIGPTGKPLRRGPAVAWQKRAYHFLKNSDLVPLSVLNENFIASTSNMFFSKNLWLRIGPFQPLRYCHDLDFLMQVFRTAPFIFDHDHTHVHYRVHPGNTIQEEVQRVRLEIAAVIAAALVTDNLDLVGKLDETSVVGFREFLNNKDSSELVILLMMLYLKAGNRRSFYETVLANSSLDTFRPLLSQGS